MGREIDPTTMAFLARRTRDVIVRVDLQGLVTDISASVSLYGYTPEDFLGTNGEPFVHPDDLARFRANTGAVLRGELEPHGEGREHRYRAADGSWVWLEGKPELIRDAEGRPAGMINIFRDVTERRRLADEVREQGELIEAAFAHAGIGMALVAADGAFMRVNEAFCRITGYAQGELLTRSFHSITHPADLDASLEQMRRLASGEIECCRMDKRYLRSDGVTIWGGLTVAAVRAADGSPKYYVAQIEDQNEQRAAQAALSESEARFRAIGENTKDMIVMSDLTGRVRYASPSTVRYGWRLSACLNESFVEWTHPDDVEAVRAAFERLYSEGRAEPLRWRMRGRELGDWSWMESNPSLLRDPETGVATGFLDVVRDVTEQVRQEEALAEARAAAEAAAAAKSQFLANMSHEIRTPLTAVLGYAGLLSGLGGLPEAAGEYVAKIVGAGNGLLALVNDILDFSKLEAGRFEIRPRPTDVRGLCSETLELFAVQARDKGLALAFEASAEISPCVLLDGDRLRQMLINLIGNAVKFTERGGVTLRLAADPAEGSIILEVADTGPGLDEAGRARVFQRFTQIDGSTSRDHGGTGLGLAICRGLAEAMGGAIAVESTTGEGAVFRLRVPAPPVFAAEEAAPAQAAPDIDGLWVLVVDDNPSNRELARRILEAAGARVEDAASGEAALARLAEARVDVVLMDLRMPRLDGRAALRRLRANSGPNRNAPVLAFTADADLEADGDLAGFDGLVRKPIQPLEMYLAIAEATAGDSPDARRADVSAA